MVDDNNNNKFKLNKNNRRAIITMLSFFILISAAFLISEFINVKKYFPGGTVVNAEGSPVGTEIINVVSDKTEAKTEVSTTEAVSTEKVTTEVTEKPTEKVTEKPTEKKTEKTTEKAEDKTEKTTKETAEKKDNPESKEDVKLDMDTDVPELPAVAEIKGNDFADPKLFTPNKVVGEDYFDNSVFIGDSRTEALALYSGYDNINAFAHKGLDVGSIKDEKCIKVGDSKLTVEEAINSTMYDNYYISFGINELGWVYLDVFVDDINELIDIIYKHNPDAVVYVAQIVPVSKSVSDTDEIFNKENVDKFNEALYKLCQDRGDVVYLDYAASVRNSDGYLPEEGTSDGKHCSADYSRRILEYILRHTYKRVK
ncbi:GDSL-like Lipase/Acylhydrolase family [Eubacterium ruminantium]|uniref:GDSL-like Lipase/Acylhydrolase family n=1 Tax=Eubacterium ruminantium TaxID=42322 RepID=A0A1T4M117_9FIRM|nr:GDSL-type esterase/lipase family protein [Eubacterium ruminantium]SCW38008.1 GDSL-like Lipase/Acylhydrolase family [Eubacterium ruminantium]SDM45652.1 hypothetical protein SAMN04490370_103185 [Eubacterium ruminantium]SJZ60611.1 GDSL-like Lipase/Acylhydrolase family [Eubacterium ruminantium]